jgi:predicted MPP superfamily phosphohydrolase
VTEDIRHVLEIRLGHECAQRRIELERHVSDVRGDGIDLFGFWVSDVTIRTFLGLAGLYRRGCRNAQDVRVKQNSIAASIPRTFNEFTILQISDLHVDMNWRVVDRLASLLPNLNYDLCVITGDYRAKSSGPFEATLYGMAKVRTFLKEPIYGVLGDHDTICMVPGLETIGVRMLLNECVEVTRGGHSIYLAGIDDAHRFHADDISKAASKIPSHEFSILLSHTPEVYRQAAEAHFNVLLSGHTHGGQICLPGGFPLTLEANLPRRMGAAAWQYEHMIGYTSPGTGSSIVPVRFNCPPEVTLHHFHALSSKRAIPNM